MSAYWNITVIADLGNKGNLLEDRPLVVVDPDDLGAALEALAPHVELVLSNPLRKDDPTRPVNITIREMDDLSPEGLLKVVPHLRDMAALLIELRAMERSGESADFQTKLGLLTGIDSTSETTNTPVAVNSQEQLASILGVDTSKNSSKDKQGWLESLTSTIVPLGESRSSEAETALKDAITTLEQGLRLGLDDILQHPNFMAFEGTLRGIERLSRKTLNNYTLRLNLLSATPEELHTDVCGNEGPARSQIANCLFFGPLINQGEPTNLLLLGNSLGDNPNDCALLHGLASLGAWAQIPIVLGAAPSLIGLRRWQELDNINFQTHQKTKLSQMFTSLTSKVETRFLIAAAPEVLTRHLYRNFDVEGLGLVYTEGAERKRGARNPRASASFMIAELIAQNELISSPLPSRSLSPQPTILEDLIADYNGTGRLRQEVGPMSHTISDRLGQTLNHYGLLALGGAKGQQRAAILGQNTLCRLTPSSASDGRAIRLGQLFPSTLLLSKWARQLQEIALGAPDNLSTLKVAENWLRERIQGVAPLPSEAPRISAIQVQAPPEEQEDGGLMIRLSLELELGSGAPVWLAGPVWLPIVLDVATQEIC